VLREGAASIREKPSFVPDLRNALRPEASKQDFPLAGLPTTEMGKMGSCSIFLGNSHLHLGHAMLVQLAPSGSIAAPLLSNTLGRKRSIASLPATGSELRSWCSAMNLSWFISNDAQHVVQCIVLLMQILYSGLL